MWGETRGTAKQFEEEFRLAYFIHGDKVTAFRVIMCARVLARTRVKVAQDKRLDKAVGKAPSVKGVRHKIELTDRQLQQQAIYRVSLSLEIEQEQEQFKNFQVSSKQVKRCINYNARTIQDICPSVDRLIIQGNYNLSLDYPVIEDEDLLIRLVEYLVLYSTTNSYRASHGILSCLFRYRGADARAIYELLDQRQRRGGGDNKTYEVVDEIKAEMKARFGDLLAEQDGKPEPDWPQIVLESLKNFSLWETACVLPQDGDADIPELSYDGPLPNEREDRIERNRIHVLTHPECLEKIIKAEKELIKGRVLAPLEESVRNWRFMQEKDDQHNIDRRSRGNRRQPDLTPTEADAVQELDTLLAKRRREAPAKFLTIWVDGVERDRIDLEQGSSRSLQIDGEVGLIEVCAETPEGNLLLANCWLPDMEALETDDRVSAEVTVEGGQRISFDFELTRDAEGRLIDSGVRISYAETALVRAASLRLRRWRFYSAQFLGEWVLSIRPKHILALLAAVMALIWFGSSLYKLAVGRMSDEAIGVLKSEPLDPTPKWLGLKDVSASGDSGNQGNDDNVIYLRPVARPIEFRLKVRGDQKGLYEMFKARLTQKDSGQKPVESELMSLRQFDDFYIDLLAKLNQKEPREGRGGGIPQLVEPSQAPTLLDSLRAGGADLWRDVESASIERKGQDIFFVWVVPAERLASGGGKIELLGVARDGKEADVDTYNFSVVR